MSKEAEKLLFIITLEKVKFELEIATDAIKKGKYPQLPKFIIGNLEAFLSNSSCLYLNPEYKKILFKYSMVCTEYSVCFDSSKKYWYLVTFIMSLNCCISLNSKEHDKNDEYPDLCEEIF